jgi:uncharacterized protein YndB with AHSA1/START domain
MTAEADFRFDVDKDRNTMTIGRRFAANRQLVWDCHTRRDYLDQWFAPKPLSTRTKTMDFREGGHWHYAMVMPDGQEFWGRMDYKTIHPIDGYALLDGFCDENGLLSPGMPQASWDVAFSDITGGTMVQTLVTYASAEALEQVIAMGMQQGITSTMERLDELLARLTKG